MRTPSNITGDFAFFSVRHLRVKHREAMRAYGSLLNLNMEESLDLVLTLGMPLLRQRAVKTARLKAASNG